MDDHDLRETVTSRETLYEGKIITVEKWDILLPDQRESGREIVLHKGAAAIVPVDKNGYVTLVRQHRVAIDRFTWEIPAGKLDFAGEDPFKCAQRELEEETGLRANKWQKLVQVVTTPGFCTETIAIYLATELSQTEAHTDVDEFLRIQKIPLGEAVSLVKQGKLEDMKTCLGLLLAQQAMGQPDFLVASSTLPPRPRQERFPGARS